MQAMVWAVYRDLRDMVNPKIVKSIADARKRDAELMGWMHRFHGEGEWAAKVYQVIDKLTFDVKRHSTGIQAMLPYYPGQRLAGELAALGDAITLENEGFALVRLKNGRMIATGSEDAVNDFIQQAQGLEIDNPETGRPDRVLTAVRYVASERQRNGTPTWPKLCRSAISPI
jgi:hypothetical protein